MGNGPCTSVGRYKNVFQVQWQKLHGLKSNLELFDRVTSEAYYIHDSGVELAIFTKDALPASVEGYDTSSVTFSLW